VLQKIEMKYIAPILLTISVLGGGCSTKNLLKYKSRQHVFERSYFENDSLTVLIHQIKKQKPHRTNFDYWHIFEIYVIDSMLFRSKEYVDLKIDTSIVKCKYYQFIPLSSIKENNIIDGKIFIKNWSHEAITLKEDIVITDILRRKTKKLKGIRTFGK
jgi:hypothetical protein